jgi:septum formation topological specificity factor MinE
VSIIWDTGAKGLILTPNMLPKKKEELIEVIQEYRAAVDDLGDQ